ncbi:hypothetical protein P280DRAFT_533159 [Massarina eburnea CBS 473.64]|uniref:Uncharacterized protein n=1 Tax=Massarina eburnea CBS 473.64 TaxID=1395130 RepID=A0A6A6RN56_9PLEO|nr:hypothetical protein P280DRAFT_533159 [Massarina eburnea CBS 473.64]
MELQVPSVTIDDLRLFHAKHFPHAPLPEQYPTGAEEEVETAVGCCDYGEEDDGLGYYDDGVKRTLTDEQIAMFRHTEIHTILRDRRRRLEDGEPLESVLAPPPPERPASPASSSDQGEPMSISSDEDSGGPSAPVEKPKQQWTAVSEKRRAKNARNRTKNRKNHRARKKELKKKELEMADGGQEDEESDEWDPWHQANGPDVQKDDTVDLDY